MNKSTPRNLAIVLFALVAIVMGMEMSERGDGVASGDLMLPGLKERINEVSRVIVETPDDEATIVSNASGTWGVSSRDDYPADIGKIRELLLGLADAKILEEKTSDPERYEALGVRDPETAGSRGIRVTVAGADFDHAVIVGDTNQGSNRYVRVAERVTSLLVDQALSLPDVPGGWLRTDLIDISADKVRRASIRHADGETIELLKSAEDAEFQVQDVPDGRELSYSTVANGIGGALSELRLDDVRRAQPAEASTRTEFETFDGLLISVRVFDTATDSNADTDEDVPVWVALNVQASEMPADEPDTEETADEAADATPPADAADYDRLLGWQYRIPGFKVNQLTRRWEDILKAETEAETE